MSLFSRLFGDRFTQPPPDEPRLSDAAIMRELYPFGAQLKRSPRPCWRGCLTRNVRVS